MDQESISVSHPESQRNFLKFSGDTERVSASLPVPFASNLENNSRTNIEDGLPRGSSLTVPQLSSVSPSSSETNRIFFRAEDVMCEMDDVSELISSPGSLDSVMVMNGDPQGRRRNTSLSVDQNMDDMSPSGKKRERPFHCHTPRPGVNKTARNQLAVVSVLCLLFMIGEIIGGTIANSLALVSDATHLASDLSGFLVSLFAISIAARRPTPRLSFGYYRAEVLGALVSIFIIWITTGVLVYLAVRRVIHQDYTIEADSMLITAGAGVAFNIVMGIVLNSPIFGCQAVAHSHSHGGGHGHSHGHTHQNGHQEENGHSHDPDHVEANYNNNITTHRISECSEDGDLLDEPKKKVLNINIRAAFVHIIGDLFQSIGVLIAAIIIKFKPEYKIADPICTFIFSILVLITTITILRDTLLLLLEGVPRTVDYRMCKFDLETIDGVRGVHSLNIWALSTDKIVIAAHLVLGEACSDSNKLMKEATTILRKKYSAFQTTLQLEEYNDDMSACDDCLGPKLC